MPSFYRRGRDGEATVAATFRPKTAREPEVDPDAFVREAESIFGRSIASRLRLPSRAASALSRSGPSPSPSAHVDAADMLAVRRSPTISSLADHLNKVAAMHSDPFADLSPAAAASRTATTTPQPGTSFEIAESIACPDNARRIDEIMQKQVEIREKQRVPIYRTPEELAALALAKEREAAEGKRQAAFGRPASGMREARARPASAMDRLRAIQESGDLKGALRERAINLRDMKAAMAKKRRLTNLDYVQRNILAVQSGELTKEVRAAKSSAKAIELAAKISRVAAQRETVDSMKLGQALAAAHRHELHVAKVDEDRAKAVEASVVATWMTLTAFASRLNLLSKNLRVARQLSPRDPQPRIGSRVVDMVRYRIREVRRKKVIALWATLRKWFPWLWLVGSVMRKREATLKIREALIRRHVFGASPRALFTIRVYLKRVRVLQRFFRLCQRRNRFIWLSIGARVRSVEALMVAADTTPVPFLRNQRLPEADIAEIVDDIFNKKVETLKTEIRLHVQRKHKVLLQNRALVVTRKEWLKENPHLDMEDAAYRFPAVKEPVPPRFKVRAAYAEVEERVLDYRHRLVSAVGRAATQEEVDQQVEAAYKRTVPAFYRKATLIVNV